MSRLSVTSALAILILFTTCAVAQTVKIEEPKQLTFLPVGTNSAPSVATNGTEWGLTYMRYEKTSRIFFLRSTYDGDFIEGHAILEGVEDEFGYQHPRVEAYPQGWALTYEYRPSGSVLPDRYFIVLDKRGRKTGKQALIVGDQFAGYVPPIWTGSMFVVFYEKSNDSFKNEIWVAYFDNKAKRIVPDRMVTQPGETSFGLGAIVPSSVGFAIFGGEEIVDEVVRPFYMMVGLDGKMTTGPKYLDKKAEPFYPFSAVWNGNGFAVAGAEYPENAAVSSRPVARLLSAKGAFQGGPFRQTANGEDIMHGIGFDGSGYVSVAVNFSSATVYCQQLNDRMKTVGSPLIVDDSNRTDFFNNQLVSVGSDAFYFASSMKAGFSKTASNIYCSRIRFPRSGRPDIKFFNGQVHEFEGKTYALFDWLVAGCQQITMKTKGGRWSLPSTGFHAVEVTGKARFKIVATNDSGSAKAKVKLKP